MTCLVLSLDSLVSVPGGVRHEIRPIRMCHLESDFRAWKEPFSEVYAVKFSLDSKLLLVISTLYRRWNVVGTLYLDSSCVTFKYFAFLSVCEGS